MDHTIIKVNKKILCFGCNFSGQLGLDNNDYRCKPQVLTQDINIWQIACGKAYSMILKKNGEILVFGNNCFGQLGLGNNEHQNKPIILMQDESIKQIVCGGISFHDFQKEWRVTYFWLELLWSIRLGHYEHQKKPMILMQDENINQIVCGENHSMILKKYSIKFACSKRQDELFVFGFNKYGQLGLGNNKNQNKPQLLMQGESIRSQIYMQMYAFVYKFERFRVQITLKFYIQSI